MMHIGSTLLVGIGRGVLCRGTDRLSVHPSVCLLTFRLFISPSSMEVVFKQYLNVPHTETMGSIHFSILFNERQGHNLRSEFKWRYFCPLISLKRFIISS